MKSFNPKKIFYEYDPINDSFFISNKKSEEIVKGSIVVGNVSLDFTSEGKIVGIELSGVSHYLERWGFNKELLNNLQSAELIIFPKRDSIEFGIILIGTNCEQQRIPLGVLPLNNQKLLCTA